MRATADAAASLGRLVAVEPGAPIPTAGEWARQALECFLSLEGAPGVTNDGPGMRTAAGGFFRACMSLMRKWPTEARAGFARVLPFTALELRALARCDLQDESVADEVAKRLREWASRSPVFVDEAAVHAADFLASLVPHLDRWDERALASQARDRQLKV